MPVQELKFNDGNQIPCIGLGLWRISDELQFHHAFSDALKAGYKHFDSAQAYENEQFLGEAWHQAGLKREDIFITTKIKLQNLGRKKIIKSFEVSLQKLQTDYVDLVLLHFPGLPWLRQSSWNALREIKKAGKAKSIGVSNYSVVQLQSMQKYDSEMPVVNQIEMHIFLQRNEMRDFCNKNKILIEAYSPLAHGRILDDPLIQQIALKHGKTYAQIMLRWCVDQAVIPLPKSTKRDRIKENIGIFDFNLDQEDISKLKKLDQNLHTLRRSIIFR